MSAAQQLKDAACERILIFDGAFGTEIQTKGLTEAIIAAASTSRATRRAITTSCDHPPRCGERHHQRLSCGRGGHGVYQHLQRQPHQPGRLWGRALVGDINRESARLARAAARDAESRDGRPRFVAGAIGPTNKTLSLSPDVNDPGFREVDFDGLKDVYREQCDALIEGGVDFILIETIFDTLNAKAGIMAAKEAGRASGRDVPLMISMTITDLSGRNLSGHTVEAFGTPFATRVRSPSVLIARSARSSCARTSRRWPSSPTRLIMAYPNAGLPNELGAYDELPEQTAAFVREWAELGLVNILGGCCGSTPPHIAAIAKAVQGLAPAASPAARAAPASPASNP
jgi:5-methyltetrahydrofolate--homocysteine methyltransferase